LLEQYAYEIQHTDENGDIVLTENTDNAAAAESQDVFLVNDNVARIARVDKEQRQKAKEQHKQKVLRDKELLAKDQQRKEKRKKRTEKREKRRL